MADSLNAINAPRTVSLKTTVFIAALLETGYPTARAGAFASAMRVALPVQARRKNRARVTACPVGRFTASALSVDLRPVASTRLSHRYRHRHLEKRFVLPPRSVSGCP